MSVLIIEGVVATGKTSLVNSIVHHPHWLARPTRAVLSEHYTERVLELTQPTVDERVRLLEGHLSSICGLYRLWTTYRFKHDLNLAPAVLLERFHLTHAAQVGEFSPFEHIDEALSELGATLVMLYHSRETLLTSILATEHSRNPMWQRWLRSLGNEKQIEEYFLRLQENTLSNLAHSQVRSLSIEAHSAPPEALAIEVIQFAGEL